MGVGRDGGLSQIDARKEFVILPARNFAQGKIKITIKRKRTRKTTSAKKITRRIREIQNGSPVPFCVLPSLFPCLHSLS